MFCSVSGNTSSFLFLQFRVSFGFECIMFAAVKSGDAKKMAELIRQDPGFNVNMDHGGGVTLLHEACHEDSRSAVIPLLLAHPDIDVNLKDKNGEAPFYWACDGRPSCVRELLKDSRVKVNEPNNYGETPLCIAARNGHLEVIKWWIASGREIDLGEPGNERADAIRRAEGMTRRMSLEGQRSMARQKL